MHILCDPILTNQIGFLVDGTLDERIKKCEKKNWPTYHENNQ